MERRAIFVRGVVQGVGFRPFVYRLASRLELRGFVANHTEGVRIEVEGDLGALERFSSLLVNERPPRARVDELTWERQPTRGDQGFRIESSERGHGSPAAVSPDAGTCDDCLRELFDPVDRRYRYPFLNCVNCGPRLTIVTGVPYDRQRTVMAAFSMCAACRSEYEDPTNRRFHAQPAACPACGPRLSIVDGSANETDAVEPVTRFAAALRDGKIGAMKGLGGYHLVCDARIGSVVDELRRRKCREEKPLAIMLRDLDAAERLCLISPAEREQLQSWRRPIVLLRRRADAAVANEVAPDSLELGVMLPYTPLHHLVLDAVGGTPLVMTSANRAGEPIAYDNDEAQERLRGIADLFLHHDRPIHLRCDDSVVRVIVGQPVLVRRSRGYAPEGISLPLECRDPLLAVGGQWKATFAIGRRGQAILSHHLGDLDDYEAYRQFQSDIELYENLFDARPRCIAHDLHPDYASTRYALSRQAREGIGCSAVQHHHAHFAGCLAESGHTGPAIGVIFDGAGLGTDGTVWGGEFLVGDLHSFRRAGHLRCVAMPGGERAVREPWRMAASHLLDAGLDLRLLDAPASTESLRVVQQMLQRRINVPLTSSAGRLFDAVASLVGVRHHVSYEGQAAMQLESLATGLPPGDSYSFALSETLEDGGTTIDVDTRPLIREIVREVGRGAEPATISRRLHSTLVEVIVTVCNRLQRQTGLTTVALSGGVFLNALLTAEAQRRLTYAGFRVYRHLQVPPGDGGLSLGQLAVAAAQITRRP